MPACDRETPTALAQISGNSGLAERSARADEVIERRIATDVFATETAVSYRNTFSAGTLDRSKSKSA
jgi:hypothetical protein